MFCSLCMSTVYFLTGLAVICVAARFVFKKIRGKHVLSTMDSEDSAEMEALADPAQDPAEDPAAAAAIAAFVAPLVGEFAAAVVATKQLQQLRRQPEALQSLLLHWINSVDPATILAQRGRFASLPGAMLKLVQSECARMRRPPLVSLMVTNRTQDLYLNLDPYPPPEQGWTLEELEALCTEVARECKTSLRRLKVNNSCDPAGPDDNPRLPAILLAWLLEQLSGLTSVHVRGDYKDYEVDHLIFTLAHTNPGIRNLTMPRLSTENLNTIAQTWPQLETLYLDYDEFNSSEVAAVLPRLRNLNSFGSDDGGLSGAMLLVARAHDPATPAYKLATRFDSPMSSPLDPADMARVFTAFPALHGLWVLESDVPAVCAALQGRDQVKVTQLWVHTTSENPRALEPLLALVGKHLTYLDVHKAGFTECRVDLGMIGHHCPKLETLCVFARELVADGEFVVTPAFFARLEHCHVQHRSQDGPAELPPPLVHALAGSPTLGSLWLCGVPLTEELVNGLAAEREAHGALTSLKSVDLHYHPDLSLRTLVALASHAPCLTRIWLQAFGAQERAAMEEIKQRLKSYVQQSGLQVCIFT